MKPGIPWSVKGIGPEVREAAKHAARKAGMSLGEWLNTVILDQSDDEVATEMASGATPQQDYFEQETAEPAPRREDTTVRLEDIAHQLSRLAQRERESATILPYEAPRSRYNDSDTVTRILNRIDSNERQTVEAFTAVNERLSVFGRQMAQTAKPAKAIEKPEDVPGFASLETAIRNVVEHIEVSEKRTRDSLKSMQDRLGDMSQRATQANAEDLVRAAPAFAGLEQRIADLAVRLQRSEANQPSGLPDQVRKEINQLADRIEQVRHASEHAGAQAQSVAAGTAQRELRDIEGRILGLLKEAQGALVSQSSATTQDLQRLRGEIASTNKRLDDVKTATASERDVHALRVAVEQLSTRVAQGPDTRPLAEMDRRIADITRKLEQNQSAARNLPQFGELERRIAELDHRLGEAMRLQGDGHALTALEQQLASVNDRVGRTEQQLGNLETMERAIRQLYDGLEESRGMVAQAAEDAATRAADRVMAAHQATAAQASPELRALEDGLRAVRDSAANSDQRNQETLEAVHETLEQIVNKLTELETSSAGHQLAANMAQQAMEPHAQPVWSVPESAPVETQSQPAFFDPAGFFPEPVFSDPPPAAEAFNPSPPAPEALGQPELAAPAPAMPDFSANSQEPDEPADDFIAAARRAAQAAAGRASPIGTEQRPPLKSGANSRFKFSLPFLKGQTKQQPITFVGGKQVIAEAKPAKSDAGSNKRRKLILAGIVLLAAVSAFTFNIMSKSSKSAKQSTMIETPVEPVQHNVAALSDKGTVDSLTVTATGPGGKTVDIASDGLVDNIVTGSLPAVAQTNAALPVQKTDASLASIVAEPGSSVEQSEIPQPEVGSQALREAAAGGDAKAQFIIASRYLDGQGLEQNLPEAAKWYQLAASRSLAPAQYRLATLFERGKGVPQDVATALLWYERAAASGNIKAMHNAAVIAAGNLVGTPNYDKAFHWFKEAAEHGLKDSQFNLAVLYERGLGTKIDKPEALFWYTMAGRQGDKDAGKRGTQLAAGLSGSDVAAVNARINSWSPVAALDEANVVAVTDSSWNSDAQAVTPPAQTAAPGKQSTLSPDENANPVLEAQQLLSQLGFNVGEPDGRAGNRTLNAIRLFQLQSGMKVTGEVTGDLIEAMRAKTG